MSISTCFVSGADPYPNDGYVELAIVTTGVFTDYSSDDYVYASVYSGAINDQTYNRAYLQFNCASIPTDETVTGMDLTIALNDSTTSRINKLYSVAYEKSSYSTPALLYSGIVEDGTLLWTGTLTSPDTYIIPLGVNACNALNSHLSWFTLGIVLDETSPPASIESSKFESTDLGIGIPYLTVYSVTGLIFSPVRRRATVCFTSWD